MKKVFAAFLTMITSMAFAQQSDSVITKVLDEILIEGVKAEGDTLQNFYQSNVSATTETILSRMNGVTLIRRGAYGQEPVFRGLSNGQLNITIDGMKIFGACTDRMDPVTIYVEPINLSSIQAVLGPQGSQFGSTVGGSLNMKLAQPTIGKPGINGRAGIDLQSAARSISHFSSLDLSRDKSAYRINVTYRKSNNYRAGGGEEIAYSQYEKVNVGTSGKWALGKYHTLQADALFDQGWNIGFPALPMDVGQATAGIYSITFRKASPWFFLHALTAKVYHNSIAHSMDDSHRKNIIMHMDMPGKSQTSGMFLESDVHIFHEHRTLMKLEYFRNTLLGEMTMYPEEGIAMYMQTAPKTQRQDGGVYIHQQFRVDSNNKLEFSLRGDIIKDHLLNGIGMQQLEVFYPRVHETSVRFLKTFTTNYKRRLTTNLNMEIQGGYGERIPTLNERYGFYIFNRFDGYDYLGHPDLKNERSWNAELTLKYFGSKIEVQLSPFIQRINNYILGQVDPTLSTMTIGANGVKKNSNLNWANLRGIDFMMLASPSPSLQLITTLKYTYGVNSLDEAMPLIPPLKFVASLRYELKKLNIQAEWDWAAPQSHVSLSYGEQKTPSYSIVSLRTGCKINSTWQVNGGIENALDNNYREHLDWGGIPRPGRNVYVNLVYNFSRNDIRK